MTRNIPLREKPLLWALPVLFLSLLPYMVKGTASHVKTFDILDAWIPQTRILAESGQAFSLDPNTRLEQFGGGLPLSGLPSGFNVLTWLFMIFPPIIAVVLNRSFMAITAFFGMFLLLRHHVFKEESYRSVAAGAALCFALLPFFPPGGLLIAGQPLLGYCFLQLRAGKHKLRYLAYILLFPFYSLLHLGGIFIVLLAGIFLVSDWIGNKKINGLLFWGTALLAGGYFLSHFHMIYSFLDPGFTSYREEIRIVPQGTVKCLSLSLHNFISDRTHLYTAQQPFIIIATVAAAVYGVVKKIKRSRLLLVLLGLAVVNALVWGFKYWQGIAPLREKLQLLNAFNFARIYWFNPLLWYLIFGLSLTILAKAKIGRPMVPLLLICQVLFLFSHYNWEYQYILGKKNPPSLSLTYQQFYSEELFKEIGDYIGRPFDSYRIACLGIHPGIANYNGFHTLDIYANIYPLSYKHRFRKIIAREIDKSEALKRVFDDNGNRCYLMAAELHGDKRLRGLAFARGITRQESLLKIKNLEINTEVFKEMGGRYIFSAVEIVNFKENGLFLEKKFSRSPSPWEIYLYKAI